MKNLIAEITKQISQIKGCQFVSFTYLSKGQKDLARHVLNIGFNYHECVVNSKTELELLTQENKDKWDPIQKQAAAELLASFEKTLAAHEKGEQNEDYTKRGRYIPIVKGLNVNTTDNTIQLFGLSQSKVVLAEGDGKKTNSAPLTIAKNKLRKLLPVGRFREFALDESQVEKCVVNGNTLELASFQ